MMPMLTATTIDRLSPFADTQLKTSHSEETVRRSDYSELGTPTSTLVNVQHPPRHCLQHLTLQFAGEWSEFADISTMSACKKIP